MNRCTRILIKHTKFVLGLSVILFGINSFSEGPGNPSTGEDVFVANCSPCHQLGGEGKIGLAPSIRNRDFLALASDEFIKTTIQKGRAGTSMMPRPDLSEQAVSDVIAYLRALPVAVPLKVELDPSRKITGDAVAGKEDFGLYCASCHGPNGEGYAAGGSGPGIGLDGFLDAASDDYIFQTVKYGRVGTAMRPFIGATGLANLQEEDVNNIIAFLRAKNGGELEADAAPQAEEVSLGNPADGEATFLANCSPCHQAGGEGKIGLAPSIRNRDFLALASDDFIRTTIQKGRAGTSMMPRPDLSEQAVNNVIAYLRDLKTELPLEITLDTSLKVSGDEVSGGEKFGLYCASCHGAKGEGYVAGGSGPGIGLVDFQAAACDDFILQTMKLGRTGTAMKSFLGAKGLANLSEDDMGDIITFLRSLN